MLARFVGFMKLAHFIWLNEPVRRFFRAAAIGRATMRCGLAIIVSIASL